MAELAAGLIGAAATVGAANLAAVSGFTARHEDSYHKEILDSTRRSTEDFMANLQNGDVTQGDEIQFLRTRDKAVRREKEYHETIESYKQAAWLTPLAKLKKKEDVRKAKRLTRQSNHSLRNLNESMHSGSDTSSICASSGSPPGSNLAVDELQDWVSDVHVASDVEGMLADETRSDSSCSSDDCFGSLPNPHDLLSSHPTSISDVDVVGTEFHNGGRELIESERKYLEDLEIIQKYLDALSQTNLVDQDTIRSLLPNLTTLLDLHRDLLLRFEATAMLPWPDQRWGLDFIHAEDEFDVYRPYATDSSNSLEILLENEHNLGAFDHLIDVNELAASIMKPIQRLSEYPKLLDSFIKASAAIDYQHSEELKLGSDQGGPKIRKKVITYIFFSSALLAYPPPYVTRMPSNSLLENNIRGSGISSCEILAVESGISSDLIAKEQPYMR